VQAGQKTLDDKLGAQIEPGNLTNHLGPKIFFRGCHVLISRGLKMAQQIE
jgi:hypothetical protein